MRTFPNWDSFNYINFIVAVEIEFGVKFKVADIESFANVGAIVTNEDVTEDAWLRLRTSRRVVTGNCTTRHEHSLSGRTNRREDSCQCYSIQMNSFSFFCR